MHNKMSTFFIDKEGNIWACGRNKYGQLGLGDNEDKCSFKKVISETKFLSVVSSGYHSCTVALDVSGNLWCCGLNNDGQLGLGDYTNKNLFNKIDLGVQFNCVSCTDAMIVALDIEGNIWSCGIQFREKDQESLTFVKLDFPVKFTNVKCGDLFVVLLDNNGYLWCYGSNITAEWLNNFIQCEPVLISSATTFTKLSCGHRHIMVLDSEGYIWAMGSNQQGQLGFGDDSYRKTLERINSPVTFSDIACGSSHSIALDLDGNIWYCGINRYNKLGLPKSTCSNVYQKTLTLLFYEKKFLSIASSCDNVIVINNDGVVETCGSNIYGQLGIYKKSHSKNKLVSSGLNASHLMNNDKISIPKIKPSS